MSSDFQLEILPRTLAHTSDPETSHAAAHASQQRKQTHRAVALRAHARHPTGLTDDDVAFATGLELIEARRRCSDLRRLDLIEWLYDVRGRPVHRLTSAGRKARVSVITPTGLEATRGDVSTTGP